MKNEILNIIIACGAGLGWVVAIIQLFLSYFERKQKHNDNILLKAIEHFTGGTQPRSVGISLIEGIIKKNNKYYDVIVPLLTNQFIYLLLQSDTKSPIHEVDNIKRIFNLLKELILSNKTVYYRERNEIIKALDNRLKGDKKSSLNILEEELLSWKEAFKNE